MSKGVHFSTIQIVMKWAPFCISRKEEIVDVKYEDYSIKVKARVRKTEKNRYIDWIEA